ncbi:MAG: tripartite tricarboxylate transporter TctB family protein [Beijerinckiaceae bacterium]|jgi:hypothetical protein|nr:tripartite tricarboxylate transporter TctB family protein [Beijerinckiaceae bacterium]
MSLSRQSMTLFMLAVFVLMVGVAMTYPAGARFMPLTVGIPGIGLCLLQIFLDLKRQPDGERQIDEMREAEAKAAQVVGHEVHFGHAEVIDAPADEKETIRREVIVWAYFLAFIGSILVFGFYVSIPVFLITFLKERAKASWTRAFAMGGVASILYYLVFAKGLGVTLYNGVATGWLLDRLAG